MEIFVIKIISITIILFLLLLITDRISSKLAGILSGLPTASLITLLWYGFEYGTDYASKAARYNISGVLCTLGFVVGYWYVLRYKKQRFQILYALFFGLLWYCGIFVFVSNITISIYYALLLSLACICYIIFYFNKNNTSQNNQIRKKLSVQSIFLRSISASIIVSVLTLTPLFLPVWITGILSAFPSTLVPFFIIIHKTYNTDVAIEVVSKVPEGLLFVPIYSFIIYFLYQKMPILLSTTTAFISVIILLYLFNLYVKNNT